MFFLMRQSSQVCLCAASIDLKYNKAAQKRGKCMAIIKDLSSMPDIVKHYADARMVQQFELESLICFDRSRKF